MKITKPKGTLDLLEPEIQKRYFIENKLRDFSALFNFREIRTPSFEKTELFIRTLGENTDIVSKEMFTLNGNKYTLRPEMTASVMRSYIENNLYNISHITKLFYIANMFRHERPQSGRFREFWQYGAEIIGSSDFYVDVEIISLAYFLLDNLGIKNIKILINNIGTPEERLLYIDKLKSYLSTHIKDLSPESQLRFHKNPLRILDSKSPQDKEILKNAPVLIEYLEKDNINHYNNVKSGLSSLGILFEEDYNLVRGLDYYTSTTFEIISDELGAQNAILGGGRYDLLSEHIGFRKTPAIGFACGIERLFMILEKNSFTFPPETPISLFIVCADNYSKNFVVSLLYDLRKNSISSDIDYLGRSVKSQMKEADKIKAKYVIVIGKNEIDSESFILKRMIDGKEFKLHKDQIINFIKNNEDKTS